MLDDYFDYKYDLLDYRKDLRKEGETAYTDKYTYLLDGTLTLAGLRRGITAFLGIASKEQLQREIDSHTSRALRHQYR